MSMRVAVVAPGRGSYAAPQLGSLAGLQGEQRAAELRAIIERADARRIAAGDAGILEMDGADKFSARFLRGENAAPLTFAVTARDFTRLDPQRCRIVAATGNSMGWYSALYCGGALSLPEAWRLIETMGSMTRAGAIGGQVIYPIVDEDWRRDAGRASRVAEALGGVHEAGHRAGISIHFGGFEVLWGDDAALPELMQRLPACTLGKQQYPMQLYGNSAFHSPLMVDVAEAGQAGLEDLAWRAPRVPLIDGRGVQWRPLSADLDELRDYTLATQVLEMYDFRASVRVLLREYAPERIVLLGPGESLGGAVAQVIIDERWQGIDGREAFLRRQQEDPLLISMARPEQAALVTGDAPPP